MSNRAQSLLLAGLLALPWTVGLGQPIPEPLGRELQAENDRIQALWKAKKVPEAVQILQNRAASAGFSALNAEVRAGVYYNLACGASLLGKPGEALACLGMAVGEGFRDYATLKSDTDFDALRNDPAFAFLLETVRSRGDHPWILRQHASYGSAKAAAMGFTYQAKESPDLIRFRKAYDLETVAGTGAFPSRILNLLRWVHRQVRHDGNSENPEPRNAMNLLEVCRRENRGINCRMMATILNEAYLSLGFKSRILTCLPLDEKDPDCHVITTVWSEDQRKWLYLDPTFETYFTDTQGALLSVEEVRSNLIAGRPLTLAKEANWNGTPKNPAEYLDYMAKNLVRLQSPQESAYGYESRKQDRSYCELDPASVQPRGRKGVIYIHDAAAFWAQP